MSDFKKKLDKMSDEQLKIYVPDVYQRSIYNIDYAALRVAGVTCLCLDIDDTVFDKILVQLLR
jgi:hypothetical protein